MAISTECPSCRTAFRVKNEYAGKTAACPSCKKALSIPQTPSQANLVERELSAIPATQPRPSKQEQSRPAEVPAQPIPEADDSDSYALAGDAVKQRANAVRAREDALPGVGASAAGVRQAAAPTRKTRTPAEILTAFRDEITPFRPSAVYMFWLLIVAVVMVLLPLIYLAMIGVVIAAVGYHAFYHIQLFQHVHGRVEMTVALLVYLLPLVSGTVLAAFMLKPFFARPAKPPKVRTLKPEDEPLLFAFIDGVCTTVGAPRPERIEVDCDVNAFAGFVGGPLSLFGRKPFLGIGLGLAAGLDLKSFAGVMAHELGHISQGFGGRLLALVLAINTWFARVVYERDEWDETLVAWSKGENGLEIVIGYAARLVVWLARRVLWLLFVFSHFVSRVFVRQKEYDADRYEARMVGARTFAATTRRLRELNLASILAMHDLEASWQQRRLPDNYPKLIQAKAAQVPKEALEAFTEASRNAKTRLFDTHPSDGKRIARAEKEAPGEGIFRLEGPATDLFRDFDSLARAATFDFYRARLGRDIRKDQLFPVSELVETQVNVQEGSVAADRLLRKGLPPLHAIPLPREYPQQPADPKAARTALIKARNDQLARLEPARAATERHPDVYLRHVKAETAWILLRTDVRVRADDWGLNAPTLRAAETAREETLSEIRELESDYEGYASAVAERIVQALAILELPNAGNRVSEGAARREEAHVLYPCVAHLAGNVLNPLLSVARAQHALELVIGKYQQGNNENDARLINAVLRAGADLHAKLEALRWRVGTTIYYPFEHAKDDVTLGAFALPRVLPDKEDVIELLQTANTATENLMALYWRALGRLAVTVEEVERALKLPPIADDEPETP